MTELERALVALGRELDLPPEPDLRSRVRERIERRPRYRRVLVPALALLVALGIALAVPEARSAILRFFHIGAVTRSEEHTSELQSPCNIVCRLLLEKKKKMLSGYGTISNDDSIGYQ